MRLVGSEHASEPRRTETQRPALTVERSSTARMMALTGHSVATDIQFRVNAMLSHEIAKRMIVNARGNPRVR